VLHELVLRQSGNRGRIALRVERRCSIVLKQVAVEIVRAGARDERHLRAAAASEFRGEVARYDLKLLHRIRIRPERREVRTARG
jgi:hypothetical protein